MKISVAMCTYNGERYLPEQLRSIGEQALQPAELVVCDDRSSDGTVEIVQAFRQSVSFPVRLYTNLVNLGSTANFAQCIQLCGEEAIALCDQDDRWRPNKLAVCAQVLAQDSSLAGVFSDADLMGDDGEPLPQTLWSRVPFDGRTQRAFARDPARLLTQMDVVEAQGESVSSKVRTRLNRKVRFEQARADLLTCARLQRPLPALALLPGYLEYAKGFRSLMRDLVHAVPAAPPS